MATHLTLLCCAATATARAGGFPARDEPLDRDGLARAERRVLVRRPARAVRSPARAAEDTAQAMGIPATVEARLDDADHGDWAGRGFATLPPDLLAQWVTDPAAAPPGGEAPAQVRRRVRPWLDRLAEQGDTLLAITHPTIVRAILGEALGLSDDVARRVDLAPLSETILSFTSLWRLQQIRTG